MPTLGVTDTTTFRSNGAFTPQAVILTANRTLTAADSGKTFIANAVDLVVTLPATRAGLTYTFIVRAVSATTGLQISPQPLDMIMGGAFALADDKDAINTAATDVLGDGVTVVGDGNDGWYLQNIVGTWARQA